MELEISQNFQYVFGGGTTRSLPRDGGAEELRRDPTVGPHPKVWTVRQEQRERSQRQIHEKAQRQDSRGGDD